MDVRSVTSILCIVLGFCFTDAGRIPGDTDSNEPAVSTPNDAPSSDVLKYLKRDISNPDVAVNDVGSSPDSLKAVISAAPLDSPDDPDAATVDPADANSNDVISEIIANTNEYHHHHAADHHGNHKEVEKEEDKNLAAMDRIANVNMETHAADVLKQGDMVLTNEQLYKFTHKYDIQGDLIHTTRSRWTTKIDDPSGRYKKLLRVPYVFDRNLNQLARTASINAFKQYADKTCVRFQPRRNNDNDYIRIMAGGGCYSSVGKRGGSQDLSLGQRCEYTGIAVHEFMHALGYWHEQSRPDRDKFVTIVRQNIRPGMGYNFDKQQNALTQGTTYDFNSIMHYSNTAFSVNGRSTIVRADGKQQRFGQRNGLSQLDIVGINKVYCNGGGTTTGTTTTAPITVKPSKGFCNQVKGANLCKHCFLGGSCREACDDQRACGYWSGRGYCSGRFAQYMATNCQGSCACKPKKRK